MHPHGRSVEYQGNGRQEASLEETSTVISSPHGALSHALGLKNLFTLLNTQSTPRWLLCRVLGGVNGSVYMHVCVKFSVVNGAAWSLIV